MHLKARSGLFVCKKILYHFFAEFWPKTPNRPQVRREPRSSCLKGHVHPSLDKNLQGSFVISCFTFLVGTAILVNHFWGRGNWGSKTVHSLKSMISCQGCQGWHLRQGLLATRGVARLTQWNTSCLLDSMKHESARGSCCCNSTWTLLKTLSTLAKLQVACLRPTSLTQQLRDKEKEVGLCFLWKLRIWRNWASTSPSS